MTYEEWCETSQMWLKRAEEINAWRRETQEFLLTELGPRIAAVKGSGFHYAKERSFGRLVAKLAMPFQPTSNHCETIEDEYSEWLIRKVVFEDLVEQIEEAEGRVK